MGLFSRRIKDGVSGTAQIVSCTAHDGEGHSQNCRLNLVVHIDGVEPYAADAHQMAPRKKWPQPGWSVPVIVSRSDHTRVKVDFGAMPTNSDRARQAAEQAAMAGPGTPPASDSGDDRIGQLERLANLRSSGALTNEEFEAEKRKLLGT